MKKGIALGLVFLIMMMSFTSISGNQINNQIIKPSVRGGILYVGGSGPGNYSTIQSAINDSSDGDTVFVFDDSSPYYENVFINQSIDLIGENKDTTVIDGDYDNNVIQINANYVTISGFTLQNSGDYFSDAGIKLGYYNNPINYTTIFNNSIFNNENGIRLYEGSSYNNISDNNVSYNQGNGIWINGGGDPYRCIENVIQGNIISNNGDEGVGTSMVVLKTKIINNRIFNNERGGIFSDGSYDEICYNEIYSNKLFGISYGAGFPAINVLISNNKIYNNLGYGIYLWGFIWGPLVNFEISKNHIESNLLSGIQLRWTEVSKIVNNNIYNNGVNARFSNSFGNKWDGNYWRSSKNIKIISGSIKPLYFFPLYLPFITIPMFNFDFHPAKEPYNMTTAQGCGIE